MTMRHLSSPTKGPFRSAHGSGVRQQPDPTPPFDVSLRVKLREEGVEIQSSGQPISSKPTRLRLSVARLIDLADLLTAWMQSRRRWAAYERRHLPADSTGPAQDIWAWYRPHQSAPRWCHGREADELARKGAVCEWVPCFDELFLDWEVSGMIVSANDEAVGAAVRGPGSCVTVLTRGLVVLCARAPSHDDDLAVWGRWLVQQPSELERFRMSALRRCTAVIDAAGAQRIQRMASEFSSLRRVAIPGL